MSSLRPALLLLALLACRSASERAEVAFLEGPPPAFASDAQAILAELEAWRGLRFERDVVVELAAPDAAADPKLAGWYEPASKRLVVALGRSDRMGRGTLLHEMHHALQDQHFDLAALHAEAERHGADAERALAALIEGEAMLAVSERMDYDFERHAHLPETGPIDPERFEKIFHYGAGLRFVRALRDAGGWDLVGRAFQDPPRSTAEIYAPERAIARLRSVGGPAAGGPAAAPDLALPGPAAPRGAYALHLALAQDEEARPRSLALASRLTEDLAGADGGPWLLRFDDAAAAAEVAAALGGSLAEPTLVRVDRAR